MRTTIPYTFVIAAATVIISGQSAEAQRLATVAPAAKRTVAAAHQPAAGVRQETPRPAAPRKRIAVSRFEANGAFVAHYGGWDIGGGLAAQLISELTKTERFIVVERADLGAPLREQQLGMMGVVSAETAAQPGQVIGAQLIVHGSVTEFDQTAAGKGVQAGIGAFGMRVGIGGNKVTARVAIDLRIIDATTGQIVASERAEAEASQRGVSTSVSAGPVVVGNGAFSRTPLGEASREAIARAVGLIVRKTEPVAWSGRIVEVSDGAVYVNAGSQENLRPRQRLVVSTVVKQLTDPATGLSLGAVERRLGEIEIESVSEKFSVARMVTPIHAERGDLVRFAGDAAAFGPSAHPYPSNLAAHAAGPGPSLENVRQAIQDASGAASISVPPAFPMSSTAMTIPTSDSMLSQIPGGGVPNPAQLPSPETFGNVASSPADFPAPDVNPAAQPADTFEFPADPRAFSPAP